MNEKSEETDVLEAFLALGLERMILKTNHDCEITITSSEDEIQAA